MKNDKSICKDKKHAVDEWGMCPECDYRKFKHTNVSLLFILNSIPQQPQKQYSLDGQLNDLELFAKKLGLYDASDYLRTIIKEKTK